MIGMWRGFCALGGRCGRLNERTEYCVFYIAFVLRAGEVPVVQCILWKCLVVSTSLFGLDGLAKQLSELLSIEASSILPGGHDKV